MSEDRLDILKKIQSGELSAEEGFRLISEIDQGEASLLTEGIGPGRLTNAEVFSHPEPPPDFSRWKVWSWIGFGIFLLLTAVSAVWMIQGWVAHPWGWGFWLSWIPFLIGVIGMATMFSTPWLHIRIRQAAGEKPERIAISMPFPLGLVTWIFKTFPQWLPEKARGVEIGDILEEMKNGINSDTPIVVQVDDEDGEHVEIYIG